MSLKLVNNYLPLPVTTRGKPYHLGGDPKGENFLYTSGKSVVIRNISNPLIGELYTEHARDPTVAKYSPSRFYICSGDSAGTVRIWDTTQSTHILKFEMPCIGGAIRDIAWTPDSKRIVVVGDGRETFGRVFMWDSGSSVGEIKGQSKALTSCDMRPERPYRCATTSEDFSMAFFSGPPFKKPTITSKHTRFANCVRFSPDGSLLASCGSDKKIFLYDGKTGEYKSELTGHTGGVYSLCFNSDGTKLLSASAADRNCKIWDIAAGSAVSTFQFEKKGTDYQQLGCLWQGEHLLSVQLNGHINYLDQNNPDKPLRILTGHNKFTTSVAYDSDNKQLYTASYDGNICKWDESSGDMSLLQGKGHSNTIPSLEVCGGNLYSTSMDDSVRVTTVGQEYGDAAKIDAPGVQVAVCKADAKLSVAASVKSVYVLRDGKVLSTVNVATKYTPQSIAISTDATEVAVGGDDNKVYFYSLSGDQLTFKSNIENLKGAARAVGYSHDGQYFAVGDAGREVSVFNAGDKSKYHAWRFHDARIEALAWSPDSSRIATCAQDSHIFIWDVSTKKHFSFQRAHLLGANDIIWLSDNKLASVGQDTTLKTWELEA